MGVKHPRETRLATLCLMEDARRTLPQIDAVIGAVDQLRDADPALARWVARRAVDGARAEIETGGTPSDPVRVATELASDLFSPPARAINATGVILHTNLGRAPLAVRAVEAGIAAAGATPVEFDVRTGARGGRGRRAALLASSLTGAEDALMTNNNAAALVLVLAGLAARREVIVSRGELIEIGGSFRLPDILAASGAVLREVGSTNKTRIDDFASAIGPRTALLLRAHPSNFRIEGFSAMPSLEEMATLAAEHGVPFVMDTGSGLLGPHPLFPAEPDARTSLEAGADLVCFSGDKLLGGPQAGIIVGRADLVAALRAHPFARALRPGKVTLAQLEATLQLHAEGKRSAVPTWSAIEWTLDELRARATELVAGIDGAGIQDGLSVVGGGSAPGQEVSSILVTLAGEPERVIAALRAAERPVIARIEAGVAVLDVRTVAPEDLEDLRAALVRVVGAPRPESAVQA